MLTMLVAILSFGAGSEEKPSLTESLKILQTCHVFVVGPAGYGGDISAEETALMVVLESKSAEQHFKSFLKKKNLPTVLYGFLGLRWLDPAKFKRNEIGVRLKGEVQVQRGCIINDEPAHEVWLRIRAGKYDKEKGWSKE
jgi:hypothetical protein